MFDNSDPFATETISFEAKLNKYKDYILNRIQNSFQGVFATSKSQNGEPDSKGNFISLVLTVSMRKAGLWNCLITEDNRGRM